MEHYIDQKNLRIRIKELLRMANVSHLKFEVKDNFHVRPVVT